ncbi:hypothetical protein BGZ96_012546 [Linnemannia gamsii]|uniref:DASH complex subunit DAD4 n=1 Tax=Linnemannia gamsii TaxID=64522 RepID=A0ABQ7JQF4_9FUNG|nr:hypothetical protein BGZ96_012546 [Linnemannia gamsii]
MSSSAAIATATSRATQYTVLNASLEKLQKNLEQLEQNVEVTVIHTEWTKRLLTIHSSLLMASAKVLDETSSSQEQEGEYHDD